jgi:hypothetical protein
MIPAFPALSSSIMQWSIWFHVLFRQYIYQISFVSSQLVLQQVGANQLFLLIFSVLVFSLSSLAKGGESSILFQPHNVSANGIWGKICLQKLKLIN